MEPTKPAYNVAWASSTKSNCHVTNNRGWFETFTPVTGFITQGYSPSSEHKMSVQGIGEIELPVKTHLTRNGSNSQGTLTLVDVLYVPSVECNILGNPLLATCDIDLKPGTISKIIDSRTGKTVGLLDESKVWRLRLRGL